MGMKGKPGMTQLQLNNLPQLPQMETLCKIVPIIWERDAVVALWLRGSLARGEGDAYSDIDFDLAVKPEALDAWKVATFVDEAIFGGNCVGYATTRFADDAFLHHLVLSNGDLLDFGVQSAERELPSRTDDCPRLPRRNTRSKAERESAADDFSANACI